MPDPNEEQILRQRAKVIKAFEDLAEATANLNGIAKKQIDLVNVQIKLMNEQMNVVSGLTEALMMPKDGMRDVIDEAIDELRGLRDDIRDIAKLGGLDMLRAALGRKVRGG